MDANQALRPISEGYLFSALITVAGGFLDAYTYLTRGKVFATAQTGNIVLMGLRLAEGQLSLVLFYFIPVLAYALGVLAAEFLKAYLARHPRLYWKQAVLGVDCLLLLAVAFVPSGALDPAVNVAVSFISALQMQSFRSLRGSAYASTMCTGNLRSGSEELSRYLRTGHPDALASALGYYAIILFFALGAVLSAILTRCFGVYSVLFSLLPLISALLLLNRERGGIYGQGDSK